MQRTLSTYRRLLAVFCGGFLGTITRYLLSTLIQSHLGKGWPYDILFINITGAFVLSLVTVLAEATFLVGPTRRLFINVGFLGAYTTFSSLALGDVSLFVYHFWWPALVYMIASLSGGVLAVMLGEMLGQWIVRRRRPANGGRYHSGRRTLRRVCRKKNRRARLERRDLSLDTLP